LRAGCAERGADCHLALAGRAAGQQQVGDVNASNQQQETDRAQQHPEIPDGRLRDEIICKVQRWHPIRIAPREFGGELSRNNLEFGVGFPNGHSCLQAAHHRSQCDSWSSCSGLKASGSMN